MAAVRDEGDQRSTLPQEVVSPDVARFQKLPLNDQLNASITSRWLSDKFPSLPIQAAKKLVLKNVLRLSSEEQAEQNIHIYTLAPTDEEGQFDIRYRHHEYYPVLVVFPMKSSLGVIETSRQGVGHAVLSHEDSYEKCAAAADAILLQRAEENIYPPDFQLYLSLTVTIKSLDGAIKPLHRIEKDTHYRRDWQDIARLHRTPMSKELLDLYKLQNEALLECIEIAERIEDKYGIQLYTVTSDKRDDSHHARISFTLGNIHYTNVVKALYDTHEPLTNLARIYATHSPDVDPGKSNSTYFNFDNPELRDDDTYNALCEKLKARRRRDRGDDRRSTVVYVSG